MEEKEVLAMYDVRGIQKYIYRTLKLKDAMGASILIEDIIMKALKYACKKLQIKKCNLEWFDENGPKDYEENEDVTVLYIGGGNAFVRFKRRKLCTDINRQMSKYVIEQTYSLQLAVAIVDISGDYQIDYQEIYKEMNRVKSDMTDSKPLSALPIMEIELKTGFPAIDVSEYKEKIDKVRVESNVSKETYLKILKKNKKVEEDDIDKLLDSYARRGEDSRIAVVHIDGNNMGLRIRKLIEGMTEYKDAVKEMRKISYNIKNSYLDTFEEMKKHFEDLNTRNDKVKRFVRKVIVSGDDITYVCNAYIAFDTVKYFCDKISRLTMNKGKDELNINENDINEYGFTVCAGVAFIRSHFPFNVGYKVAEACCDSAKDMAKNDKNKAYFSIDENGNCRDIDLKEYEEGMKEVVETGNSGTDKKVRYFEKTGNFVDFQICKNIQCQDLEQIRKDEYITASGENLLVRPYYIEMEKLKGSTKLNEINGNKESTFSVLKKNIQYFSNEGIVEKKKNMPRSMSKDIRNKYSLGEQQVQLFAAFLDSRAWKLPDGGSCKDNMYIVQDNGQKIAKWYDALEIMDYCSIKGGEGNDKKNKN